MFSFLFHCFSFQKPLFLPDAAPAVLRQVCSFSSSHFSLRHALPALPVVNTKFKAFDQRRFDMDLEIEVHSAVRICKAVLPAMARAKFGRVLFIQTSYTIGCPPKNTAAYVMAKSAIGGLVKSLAVEYAKFGITVNCVAPSMMETHFLKDTPDLIVQAAAEDNPMGRNATPADVVPAMAFLLSDEAGFITGVTLPVTGGSAIV